MSKARARLRQLVAEDSYIESSCNSSFVSEEQSEPSPAASQDSLQTYISSKNRMEEVNAAMAVSIRKKVLRMQVRSTRMRERMGMKRANETAETSILHELREDLEETKSITKEFESLTLQLLDVETNPTALEEDDLRTEEVEQALFRAASDCKYLMAQRAIACNISALEVLIRGITSSYETSPDNDHSTSMNRLHKKAEELEEALEASNMPEEEELRQKGNLIVERAHIIQGRVAGTKVVEIKPTVSPSKSKAHIKLKYVEVPTFSGKTEDWMSFFRLFNKAVHANDQLDEDSKLTYLVQAIQDPRTKRQISERLDEPGVYDAVIKELIQTHDKPRWMHRKHTEQLRCMQPHPRTREGLMLLLSEGQLINNGLLRLKGGDISQILTSTIETVMDDATRALWNQKTDDQKHTPPVADLFAFLKDQADQLEDTSGKGRHKQVQRQKGLVHNVTSPHNQRQQQNNQQQGNYQHQNNNNQRGGSQPGRQAHGGQSTSNKSPCPMCQGGHPLYFCVAFEGLAVAARKEKVMQLKLCWNCLKPHHMARECNSSFRCKAPNCGRKHNTLLHEERVAPAQPPQPQQLAAVAAHDSDDDGNECLLMTARVTLLGPAGQITVRALLDSGSTLSIVTEQLAKQLKLEPTGKSVSISGIKSATDTQLHPMLRVQLASEFQPEWRADVAVASMKEVIRELPLQNVPHVRRMAHLRDLHLADSQFDKPGKIEVLLGQNIWRHLFMDGRVKGSNPTDPEAWETVFGWTVLGNYSSSTSQQTINHLTASVESNRESDALLARFQELEEPGVFSIPLTAKEVRVETHYKETHSYDSVTQRYTVKLPKVDNPPPLGESKTQAVNRAKANERSLLKKGRYEDFQAVMGEYLTLGHAVEVPRQQPQSPSTQIHLGAATTGVAAPHSQRQTSRQGVAAIGVAAPPQEGVAATGVATPTTPSIQVQGGVAATGVAAPQLQLPHQSMQSKGGAAATGVAAPQQQSSKGSPAHYFMPVHSVVKETSTTTKTRAVFDASAKTTSHYSLNDLLAVGPTLHPTIDKILLRFRSYPVAISSDIAKMYREVLLDQEDQPLHRYIWRASTELPWKEYQMTRVTFGVAASPYLAVKTLQQAAADHGGEHPKAQWHVLHSFYVDDFLGGADSVEDAMLLYNQLSTTLEKGCFSLRKWRSSSNQVLKEIPSSLQESMPTKDLIDQHSATYPKALGVSWDSGQDTMFTNISLPVNYQQTKRGVISDVARTFDVLGWITPAILPMKALYRDLWKEKLDWDDPVSEVQSQQHLTWRNDLPMLKEVQLPRYYFRAEAPSSIQLHGFADASITAYAAVVYIRATYPTLPPSIQLVVAKSKVAPIKTRTIPQLELCAANLLARLITSTGQTLEIPKEDIQVYSDNTTVLGWLGGDSGRYCVFSGHRIAATTILLPIQHWYHVPTAQNPADVASRGISATDLKDHQLWWHGPPWLADDPISLPRQPTQQTLEKDRKNEMKPEPKVTLAVAPQEFYESKQNSYLKLVRVTSWMLRFMRLDAEKERSSHLTVSEGLRSTTFLTQRSQQRSFQQELTAIMAGREISPKSTILVLHPMLGKDKLLRVGGRLWNTKLPYHTSHPIILAANDHLAQVLFLHYHLLLGHCGPSTLLAHSANLYHVVRGRVLSRNVCMKCVTCRKQAARTSSQLLGQLPPFRVEPQAVFYNTGMDFCGPFWVRKGYTRKPVNVKVYLSIFICMATKAVHLEVVSDLTTPAFIASLDRFVSRRGLPFHLHSDNGSNYIGARNQLAALYKMLSSTSSQDAIHAYMFAHHITWHNSPQRAPHFGGLWEAAVKSSKFHLKRIIGQENLTYEELSTVVCQVESFLNSRPLGPITSHDVEGRIPLTPSHFLIGRAARAYPKMQITGKPTTLQRWERCQKATQDFWDRWSQEYLQHLQKATRWHHKSRNFRVNDLVMLTDGSHFKAQWSMAKVIQVYPGRDGLVRTVDVQLETRALPKTHNSNQQLAEKIKTTTSILRRPITKLALLLGDDELPENAVDLDQPVPSVDAVR